MPSSNPRYAQSWKKRDYVRKVLLQSGNDVCPLCMKPIDKTLGWYIDPKDGKKKRHPMSAEVDEITPVSRGGSPTDLSNLRLVHRICNQKRGNKMVSEMNIQNKTIHTSQDW